MDNEVSNESSIKLKKGTILEIGNKAYKLIQPIGEGGSGLVWQVECDGSKYGIKFLKQDYTSNKFKRFKNEIEWCKSSKHKNIIKIIDETVIEDKYCYIMPYYSKTLRDIINDDNIGYLGKLKYIEKLCEAVEYIHKKNVIHRDIKPENILIEKDSLVLADFGIAHFKNSRQTKKSDLLANRDYLAPEQRRRKDSREVTIAADIYSLGSIINECITKSNTHGSDFKRISDDHPELLRLEKLVYSMIKQNPIERPIINEVSLELKLQIGEREEILKNIKENIKPNFNNDFSDQTLEKILNRASQDILTAKYIFENKSNLELRKYNHNYHMEIGYCLDKYFLNLYFQELLYKKCKRKFEYESNGYKNGSNLTSLDLKNNKSHMDLYEKFKGILSNFIYDKYDLSGMILKIFSSCYDYHCREILKYTENDIKKRLEALTDAPIIYIIIELKNAIIENEALINTFNIEDHILINWKRPIPFDIEIDNDDELIILEDDNKEKKILSSFQDEWNVMIYKIDNSYYSVKFQTLNEYNHFREYALEISKDYYVFEGDVLDLIRIKREYNGIVELKRFNDFDINNTLAKILGLRKDY